MIHQGTARYPVTEIILHCADTRPEWMTGHSLAEKVAKIRRWHVQRTHFYSTVDIGALFEL